MMDSNYSDKLGLGQPPPAPSLKGTIYRGPLQSVISLALERHHGSQGSLEVNSNTQGGREHQALGGPSSSSELCVLHN